MRKERCRKSLLQIEATHKAEMINIAECLNTKYKWDQFVDIITRHKSNQPNMNLTVKKQQILSKN